MRQTLLALFLFLGFSCSGYAQATFHIFPQFVDGQLGGYSYRSTLTIQPWFDSDAPTCSLNLYGMTAIVESVGSGSVFQNTITAGSFSIRRTTGIQPLQTGYATLTCTDYVFAQVLYSYYDQYGTKIAEATVFSSPDAYTRSMLFDNRDNANLGIAISNNTDIAHTYTLTATGSFGTKTGTVQIPARHNVSRFLTEFVSGLPSGAIGKVEITATDVSKLSAIGLRVTGAVFTTIPAN
jgi:hypothetical protein